MADGRTLKITINIDSAKALKDVAALHDAIAKIASGTGGRAAAAGMDDLADAAGGTAAEVKKSSAALSRNQVELDKNRRSAYAYSIAGYQIQATLGLITQQLQGAVASFAEFDFTVRRAAGALGVFDQTGAAFDKLGQAIENTAVQTKLFDPNQVAQGYYYWGSTTGQVVKSQEDLLRVQKQVIPVMQMAAITQTDLQTSLKGVYAVMQQYNMPVENAGKVTEKLFLVSQKTAAELPDLLDSFKMVGPVANEIGVSFDEVVGMLGALANAGIKGGMAGRALRQTFIKLTDPTVRASNALDAATAATYGLGTSFNDIVFPEGKFIGMQGYLDVLSKLTKDLTDQERNRLLGIITTNNELPALIKLVNANTTAMRSNTSGVIDNARAMYSDAEATKVFAGSVENQMQSAQATFSEFGNVVGSTMIELGKNVWQMVAPVIRATIEASKFMLMLIQTNPIVAKLASALLLLVGVVVAVGSSALIGAGALKLLHAVLAFDIIPSMRGAIGTAGSLGNAFANLAVRAGLLSKSLNDDGIEVFSRKSGALTGTLRAIGSRLGMLLGNPLGIAMVAAVAVSLPVIAELYSRHSRDISKRLLEMQKVFDQSVEAFGTVMADAIDAVVDGIESVGDAIGDVTKELADWVDYMVGTNNEVAKFLNMIRGGGQGDELPYNNPYFRGTKLVSKNIKVSPEQRAFLDSERTFATAAIDAGTAYADGVAKYLSDKLAAKIGPSIAAAFKTGDAIAATAAVDVVKGFLDSALKEWDASAKPGLAGAVEGLGNLLDSKTGWATRLGAAMSNDIVMAFKSGNPEREIRPAITRMLQTIDIAMKSSSPARRKEGTDSFREFLTGFTSLEGLTKDQRTQLTNAIALLTVPASAAAGAAAGRQFLASMLLSLQGNATVVQREMGNLQGEYRPMGTTPYKVAPVARPADKTGGTQQTALEKALDVARQAADLAENLQKVAGKDIKAMVKSSMGKIAEAVLLADKITYNTTKSFSKAKLKAVAEFSENSAKVMTLISAAVDAFDKLTRFKKVPLTLFTQLESNIKSAVKALENVVKSFTDDKVLARTIVFADSAKAVMDTLGTALDVLTKMPSSYERIDGTVWTNLTRDIAAAVKALGEASKRVSVDLVGAAKAFALDVTDAIAVIGSAVDLFAKVGEMPDYQRQANTLWTELTADIAAAVNALGRAAGTVKGPLVTKAKDFAEAVGGVIDILGKAVDLLAKLPDLVDMPDGAIFTPISERIGQMATALGEAAGNVDKKLLTAAKAFAEKVGPVVSVIGEAVTALSGVASFVTPDAAQVSNVVVSIRNVMDAMAREVDPKKFDPKKLKSISNFALAAVDALNAVKTANEVFAPVVQDLVNLNEKMVIQPPEVAKSVGWIVEVMNLVAKEAVKFPPGVTQAVTRVTTAALQVIETIKNFFDIIAPQDLSQAGMSQMVTNISESIKIALATVKSALQPFVDGFTVTGGDIVKNITNGINSQLPALKKAIDDMKALLREALSTQAGIAGAMTGGTAAGRSRAQIQAAIDTENKWLSWYATVKSPTQHQRDLAQAHREKLASLTTELAAAPYAKGGPFQAGQLMLVGERGPELIVPSSGGQVIPNNQIGSVLGGGATIRVEHVVKGDVSNLTATQVAAMLNSSMGSLATAIATSSKR